MGLRHREVQGETQKLRRNDAAKTEKTLSAMKKNELYPVGRTRWSLGGFLRRGCKTQSVF